MRKVNSKYSSAISVILKKRNSRMQPLKYTACRTNKLSKIFKSYPRLDQTQGEKFKILLMSSQSLTQDKLNKKKMKSAILMKITMMRKEAMKMREPLIRLSSLRMVFKKKLSRRSLNLLKE
jgi:hypothetical protein